MSDDGQLKVLSNKYREEEIIRILSGIEQYSNHHIALFLGQLSKQENNSNIHNFSEKIACGVSYEREGIRVKIGRKEYLGVLGENFDASSYISFNDELVAEFCVSEKLESGAFELINYLKENNVEIFILSGDKHSKVMQVACELNLEKANCFSELSPDDKLEILEKVQPQP